MAFKFIIFDLDDTLYASDNGLRQALGRRIELWLQRQFDLTWDEAITMRHDYFIQYGTTLGGLIVAHDVDVHDYLYFSHAVPVDEYVAPNLALAKMLDAIPLRKTIYTNGISEYARRVLQALGVADRFEQVIGIEEVGLRSKPHLDAYERMLTQLDAQGSECIMVEDSARNLCPAKALGMTTIWLGTEPDGDESIDFVIASVLDVGRVVEGLLRHAQ
ncbi:MAG: pyrimidine 5'-nucleotidase [Chloroflexi bacterium]|nr:pyrimidine 5'-nucleotidase [Chloroflexota bacterium]